MRPDSPLLLVIAMVASGCGRDGAGGAARDAGARGAVARSPDAGRTDAGPDDGAPPWAPGQMLASLHTPRRGLVDVRGLIHEHSVYSHDACDNAPRDPATDAIDDGCFRDFRDGLCRAGHDFVFLTDHPDSFARTEYPEALLHRPARGDVLVERGGGPVANRAGCPDGTTTLLVAGTESSRAMPVGLEGHAAATADERTALYGELSAASIAKFHAAGAVALVAHTENHDAAELATLPLDGFEMYNLHANFTAKLTSAALPLLGEVSQPDQLMQSDLVLLPILFEDPVYLSTWGSVLARGARRVTTMGTDAHRNSLNVALPDGERVDSWGRMNRWFSNHLLVRPAPDGSWDDGQLKDALRAARLYGVFEVFGYASGFDFRAEDGDAAHATHEMGEEVTLSRSPTLVVETPKLRRLDPAVEPPLLRTIVLRAKEGGWDAVGSGSGEVRIPADQPGAYRAEVRITPRHLRGELHAHADLADTEFVWVYSNAVHVVN